MTRKISRKSGASAATEEQGENAVEILHESVEEQDECKPNLALKAVYGALYGASYGVVFTSLLVQKLFIPKNSLVDKALHDGAVAARKAIEEKEELLAEVHEQTVEILSGEDHAPEPA